MIVSKEWQEMSLEDRHMFLLRDIAKGFSEPLNEDSTAAVGWALQELQRLRPDLIGKGFK